jgi:serine/tyrosine/threonine adenylyltransferase
LIFLNLVSGNTVYPDTKPYAMAYAGHQFGNWAGQLGDGRAINLFEILHNNQRWTLQLKGAGETPYSRTADGFAVLRSSIREHLCSEAMYHLGVPTTRSLSLVTTGDKVLRDVLYNGNAAYEDGAVVCRVAPSFIRFGNFQLFCCSKRYHKFKSVSRLYDSVFLS